MKKILFSTVVLFTAVSTNAQSEWQKISDPGLKKISETFKSPPAEYGMILWWGCDGPVTDTVIRRDLDRIKVMGFLGIMLEIGESMSS